MPAGKTHNAVTLLTGIYAGLGVGYTTYLGLTGWESIALPGGCLLGFLLSPDLDIDHGNISDATIRTKIGCLPAALWRLYWTPYAWLIPHRHWLSHMPVLSTLLRVVYAFWWLGIIWPAVFTNEAFWWAFLGLVLADFHHAFLDAVT